MAIDPQNADKLMTSLLSVSDFLNIDRGQYSGAGRYLKFSPMSYAALRWISGAERPTPTGLAGQLGTAPATVTSLLDRLETSGLVTRAPSSRDRRKIALALTARGHRAAAAIAADDRAHVSGLLSRLPKNRRAAFLEDITAMTSGAGEMDEAAVPSNAPKRQPKSPPKSQPKPKPKRGILGRKSNTAQRTVMTTERRKPTRRPR